MGSGKRRILFIVRNYNNPGAQAIRFKKICFFLSQDYDIDILMLHHEKKLDIVSEGNIRVFKLPYSYMGRKINKDLRIGNNSLVSSKGNWFKEMLKFLNFKKFFFPDTFVSEFFNVRKFLINYLKSEKVDIVVGSSFPHSVLLFSKVVKSINGSIKWFQDIGDPLNHPFYSKNFFLTFVSEYYERYFSKFVDVLVVTNKDTSDYYIQKYKNYTSNNVFIIPQGADRIEVPENFPYLESNFFKFVYAGGFYDKIREPFELYKAISLFKTNVIFDIYGNISQKFIPSSSFDNIYYKGSISHSSVLKSYTNSDCIVLIDNSSGIQTPGKVFEVLSARRVVLFVYSNKFSPTFKYLSSFSFVYFAENNMDSISKEIQKIIKDLSNSSINCAHNDDSIFWDYRASQYKILFEIG